MLISEAFKRVSQIPTSLKQLNVLNRSLLNIFFCYHIKRKCSRCGDLIAMVSYFFALIRGLAPPPPPHKNQSRPR